MGFPIATEAKHTQIESKCNLHGNRVLGTSLVPSPA
jgi:hypothetical protein